jgi:hypothetical protein
MAITRDPIFGLGTKIKAAATTGVDDHSYTQIPRVTGDITLPGGSANRLSLKTHDDTSKLDAKAAGLIDTSDVGFKIFYDHDAPEHRGLLDDWEFGDFRNYEIEYPDPVVTKERFRGQVMQFSRMAPMGGFMEATIGLSVFTHDFDV